MTQIISFNDCPIVRSPKYGFIEQNQIVAQVNRQIDLDELELQLDKMFPDKQFLSIKEFSKFFSVCYETIRKKVSSGEITYIIIGKKKVIPKSEIIRIVNRGGF